MHALDSSTFNFLKVCQHLCHTSAPLSTSLDSSLKGFLVILKYVKILNNSIDFTFKLSFPETTDLQLYNFDYSQMFASVVTWSPPNSYACSSVSVRFNTNMPAHWSTIKWPIVTIVSRILVGMVTSNKTTPNMQLKGQFNIWC